MTGVIEKCNKNRAQFFFIRGDDGKRYFGHRHQVVNMKNYKQFCYEGNRVKFVPGELPQKEGDNQEANCIEFETVDKYDMMAKKIREQESEIEKLKKEQEAVEPYPFEDIWKCGNCGDGVVAYEELGVSGIEEVKFDYCPTCGRRVLWEGR